MWVYYFWCKDCFCISSVFAGCYPFEKHVTSVFVSGYCTRCWVESPLLSVAVITALSGREVFSPVLELTTQINFRTLVWGGWLEHSCYERNHSVFLWRSHPSESTLCGITCNPLCSLTKYIALSTAYGSISTVGIQTLGLGVSQMLFSQIFYHRSIGCELSLFISLCSACCKLTLMRLWSLLSILAHFTN